ncbi:MAG TPA: hypothetical protein DCP91_11235 [Eggerthellaceae bacterium]|nr:hypothetical protein [Eggerthellaceae bacterium]
MQPFDTGEFYRASCERRFVKVDDIARNIAWTTPTEWGDLQITINLSKPEKDPRAIAAAASGAASGQADYVDPATGFTRPCPLCVTQADLDCGYARELSLGGERWGMWYSPYAYYTEHCIAMSWQHRPMHVDRPAFECLFDFVDQFPHYFIGSNADLPIVGGSILGHDHFQGGRHTFPMNEAPISERFEMTGFSDVQAGIVKWPLSVVRLVGSQRGPIVRAACAILQAWRGYSDESAGIAAFTDGVLHNTITPILSKRDGAYVLDLALRCNITSAQHPLGVFHPHEELHHIKKENIGLIEVMGLAILPPRVQQVMADRGLTRDDVGHAFAQVLEHAGVFKWDPSGRQAFHRFLSSLG